MRLKKTGSIFDEILGGGIPAGSIIFFSADPSLPSEQILYNLCASRKTYYLVTDRHPKRVKEEISAAGFSNIEVIDLRDCNTFKILEVLDVADDANIVIDTFLPFINDTALLENIVEVSGSDKDILLYLCIPKGSCEETALSRLIYICDVFMDIRAERTGDEIIVKFAAPKIRGATPLTKYVRLKISPNSVEIDTSRDIV